MTLLNSSEIKLFEIPGFLRIVSFSNVPVNDFHRIRIHLQDNCRNITALKQPRPVASERFYKFSTRKTCYFRSANSYSGTAALYPLRLYAKTPKSDEGWSVPTQQGINARPAWMISAVSNGVLSANRARSASTAFALPALPSMTSKAALVFSLNIL